MTFPEEVPDYLKDPLGRRSMSLSARFDRWLIEQNEEVEVLMPELMTIFGALFIRLRLILKMDDVGEALTTVMNIAERKLETGTAIRTLDGEPLAPPTPEEREANPEAGEVYEQILRLATGTEDIPDSVPEDWS